MTSAERIFDEIAAHHHGRMQTAGWWVPWGDYTIDVVNCRTPADWTVTCRRRIVAKGGADTVNAAWRAGCQAIADDLQLERWTRELDRWADNGFVGPVPEAAS